MAINLGVNEIKKISLGNVEIAKISLGGVEVWSGMLAGDSNYGFYGEVPVSEFITGDALASAIGLTAGTAQHSNEPWLKFALNGKTLYVAKKSFRYGLNWNSINAVGAIFGTKKVTIGGKTYKVRVLKGATIDTVSDTATTPYHRSEYNKLMLPIHIKASTKAWETPEYVESDLPNWNIGYTDADLNTVFGSGNGTTVWCQESRENENSTKVLRGAGTNNRDASSRGMIDEKISTTNYMGWRPCLEFGWEGVYVAQDSDFVKVEGFWVYRGTELEIKIPHVIQGESITSYQYMFMGSSPYNATPVTKVVSDNPNVTNMRSMFNNSKATTLDLSSFNTSNVTTMYAMFGYSKVTTLDLSSFDTSNVTTMDYMFIDSQTTVGYARTQADANKFNATSDKPTRLNFVVKP